MTMYKTLLIAVVLLSGLAVVIMPANGAGWSALGSGMGEMGEHDRPIPLILN